MTSLLFTALGGSCPIGKAYSEARATMLGLLSLFPGQSPQAAMLPDWEGRILSLPQALPNVPPSFGAGQLSGLFFSGEVASLLAQVSDPDGDSDIAGVEALVVAANAPVVYGPAEAAGLHSPQVEQTLVPLALQGSLYRNDGVVLARDQLYAAVFLAEDQAGNVSLFEPESAAEPVAAFKGGGVLARAAAESGGEPRQAVRLSAVSAPAEALVDVNRDGVVGPEDVLAFSLAWGERTPAVLVVNEGEEPGLAVAADLNHDGVVDAADLVILAGVLNGM